MSLEQLALLGIVIFAFMAVATSFNAFRSFKRSRERSSSRLARRQISGTQAAYEVARSVVRETKKRHPAEAQASKDQGRLTKKMEKELAEAETYFLSRVESRHRALFTKALNELILDRKSSDKD